MNALFGDIRSKARLATLAVVCLMAFSLYGIYCVNTVSEVKVGGPIYRDIAMSKDLIADVLPPPEYLVETCLTAYQMLDARDTSEARRLEARALRLSAEYMERHAYWEKALPPGEMRTALVDSSFAPAQRALDALARRFLPALRAGKIDSARAVLDREIRPAYEEHRKSIDAVVALAHRRNEDAEAGAAMAVRSRIYGQSAVGVLMFAFLVAFSSYVVGQERKAGLDARGGTGPGAGRG